MSLTKPRNPLRVAVVIGAILVVVNIAIWGGRSQRNGAANPTRPVEIQQLFPNESDLLLPQGTVGADLRDQFTGQISVDGVVSPADQTTAGSPLGVVTFDPAPGKVFTEWSKGTHTATIEWWPKTIATPEEAAKQQQLRHYMWAFSVG